MKPTEINFARETRFAKSLCGDLSKSALTALKELIKEHKVSVMNGDVRYLNGGWYVTHSGLLKVATRRRCAGIRVQPVGVFCDKSVDRWIFKATVFKSRSCKGFIGYGDADPSNVSFLVHGAEMRIAETRAVNRALRKAYGIGICSVEEIGPVAERTQASPEPKELTPLPASGNGGVAQSAITSAKSSASISWTPPWSRHTRQTSAP